MEITPFSVVRYSFFNPNGGATLRYTEHSPHKEEGEHPLCGCTKNVTQRPEGQPTSTSTYVKSHDIVEGRDFELSISERDVDFTFHWDDPTLLDRDYDKGKAHAYFWFHADTGKLQVEITKKGCGLVDCFFNSVYVGNNVDTSRFVRGCEPSKAVTLSEIGPRDVWCHEGYGNKEGFAIFSDSIERTAWLAFFDVVRQIHNAVLPHIKSGDSVDNIRASLDKDVLLKLNVYAGKFWLGTILETLEKSEMFQLGVKFDKESR